MGDWRGLYGQKNAAGAVCAMTALLFLFTRNGRYNWIGWLVAAACFGLSGDDPLQDLAGAVSGGAAGGAGLSLLAGVTDSAAPSSSVARGAADSGGIGRRHFLCRRDLPCAGRPHRIHRPRRDLAGLYSPLCAIIPGWARASAPSTAPAACRRCTIMSARLGRGHRRQP